MPVKGLVLELVSHHLKVIDFFHLQAAGIALRTSCLEEAIWSNVMERKFSPFQLHPALLQPAGWHILGPLFLELQRTHAAVAGVALTQEVQVQRLTSALRAANRSNRHVGPAQVFVGRMCFPEELLSMAVEDQKQALDDPPSCVADAFLLRSNLFDDPAPRPSASLFHGPILYFGWQNGNPHLAIRDDGVSPSDIPMIMGNQDRLQIFTVDVAVCSSAFRLNHRSVEVAVNGPWKMCTTGFFFMAEGKEATVEALSGGVPCVVCIRFGRIMQPLGIACMLHLDKIRHH